MSLGGNKPFNSRAITDINYIVSQSFSGGVTGTPATAVNTPAVDFRQATPYPTTEKVIVNVSSSAVLNTTGSKNINVFVQHSDDNVTFTNISEVANPLLLVANPGTSLTSSAVQDNILLPPSVKRYVRASALSENTSSLSGGPTGSFQLTVYF